MSADITTKHERWNTDRRHMKKFMEWINTGWALLYFQAVNQSELRSKTTSHLTLCGASQELYTRFYLHRWEVLHKGTKILKFTHQKRPLKYFEELNKRWHYEDNVFLLVCKHEVLKEKTGIFFILWIYKYKDWMCWLCSKSYTLNKSMLNVSKWYNFTTKKPSRCNLLDEFIVSEYENWDSACLFAYLHPVVDRLKQSSTFHLVVFVQRLQLMMNHMGSSIGPKYILRQSYSDLFKQWVLFPKKAKDLFFV